MVYDKNAVIYILSATILCTLSFAFGLYLIPDRAKLPKPRDTMPDYYIVEMEVTGYCLCERCCGIWATKGVNDKGERITASGSLAKGFLVAAPSEYPFGTLMVIPDYAGGQKVPVLDRGGAIKNNKIDLLFTSHEKALQWGRRILYVKVYY